MTYVPLDDMEQWGVVIGLTGSKTCDSDSAIDQTGAYRSLHVFLIPSTFSFGKAPERLGVPLMYPHIMKNSLFARRRPYRVASNMLARSQSV